MNVSSIKTPGVYINEIDAFPQSVAQVATAIPAFVGYTEKGPTEPTRIVSMLEYMQFFGGGPQPSKITIKLDSGNVPTDDTKAEESIYNLFNSLQLFYANGGGECYIVSIGSFSNDITSAQVFKDGLDKLESYDEPTLLLFPDAVALSSADLGIVQQHALKQCNKLMDRFVIMDVKQDGLLTVNNDNFRTNVGSNNSKYGAAYSPYLVSSFENKFRFSSLNKAFDFSKLYTSTTKSNINDFVALYESDIKGLKSTWDLTVKTYPTAPLNNNTILSDNMDKVVELFKTFGNTNLTISNANFKSYIENDIINLNLKPYLQRLFDFAAEYKTTKELPTSASANTLAFTLIPAKFDTLWGALPASATTGINEFDGKLSSKDGATKKADYSRIDAELKKIFNQILNSIQSAFAGIESYELRQENILIAQLPVYAPIIAKLNQSMNTTPPSGAIAGIYAQTDATRGVWKAPANLSINGIIGLTDDINDSEQEKMNIDENGKSINAIRKFTGKGFLVWGARTLDGNSNDWRYINVRRLANMIEESCKKACMHYVFEPNVAQTWVNVKGMIENYLNTVWSDGGLAGAKPEHAFFVSVGLNQTMTALDILEGRMVVKIGYAPSRPAEFIILEFKQMLQQS